MHDQWLDKALGKPDYVLVGGKPAAKRFNEPGIQPPSDGMLRGRSKGTRNAK